MLYLFSCVVMLAACLFYERSQRKTFPVKAGLNAELKLPHEDIWILYNNQFSLCSKKLRVCLAEYDVTYTSKHVDFIETGSYENISRGFLKINPAATVPALLHKGNPIYGSHAQLKYIAEHVDKQNLLVPADDSQLLIMNR